ncbi:hypothetical protein L9F63_011605, partial [Diploptera punctata]
NLSKEHKDRKVPSIDFDLDKDLFRMEDLRKEHKGHKVPSIDFDLGKDLFRMEDLRKEHKDRKDLRKNMNYGYHLYFSSFSTLAFPADKYC